MSQQADVTLNTVVYSSSGQQNGVVLWFSRAGGVLNSFSKLAQRYAQAVGGLKLTKISYKVEVPVVATADTTCSCTGAVLRTSMATIEFSLAPDATLAERTDLYLRVKDLVASTVLQGAVKDLNPAYA